MAKAVTKKASRKSSGAKSPAFELAVSVLERSRDADYATVKAAGESKGLMIHPIVYGRAQMLLGIVKMGDGKVARAKRKLKQSTRSSAGLEQMIALAQQTEAQRDEAVRALEKIRRLIDAAI